MIIGYIGDYCAKFIDMSFESVKEADKIIFVWGAQDLETKRKLDDWAKKFKDKLIIINNPYDQENKGMNGKARNVYLEYAKKHFPNEWMLVCDPDEVVENMNEFKKFINQAKPGVYSPKMRHLIGNLNYEDSIQETHFVLNRFFKISEVDKYPEQEHPLLIPKSQTKGIGISKLVIWHLSYIDGMFNIKKKYENHLNKSKIHSKDYLDKWYFEHLFNLYPRKQFNPLELPDAILNEFQMSRDKLYFQGRENMEVKHYQDAINWKEFFKPKTCLIYGCGMGQRVYTMNKLGVDTYGMELSEYAVKNRLHERVSQGSITEGTMHPKDLVVAFDVLEHLKYEDLGHAIDNMIESTKKYILISVPVIGNPALEIDPTHIIKESEEWWLSQFEKRGLKLIKTPDNFLYKEQVYIFEK